MKKLIRDIFRSIKEYNTREIIRKNETNSVLLAKLQIKRIKELKKIDYLEEAEFKVFSE